jgi:hypothetical protein
MAAGDTGGLASPVRSSSPPGWSSSPGRCRRRSRARHRTAPGADARRSSTSARTRILDRSPRIRLDRLVELAAERNDEPAGIEEAVVGSVGYRLNVRPINVVEASLQHPVKVHQLRTGHLSAARAQPVEERFEPTVDGVRIGVIAVGIASDDVMPQRGGLGAQVLPRRFDELPEPGAVGIGRKEGTVDHGGNLPRTSDKFGLADAEQRTSLGGSGRSVRRFARPELKISCRLSTPIHTVGIPVLPQQRVESSN